MLQSKRHLQHLHSWASVAPLISAIFAPFSVLFDIPALTEPWFIKYDPNVLLDPNKANSIPDVPGNIVLSAVGLVFNILANVLLVLRFSLGLAQWRLATRLSVLSWILKVIVALVNVVHYGQLPPNATHGEGFWCAVVSLIICGVIAIFLVFHWIMEVQNRHPEHVPTEDQIAFRIAGRHFMFNVTFFVIDMALFALISSIVESWTYLQGVYFSIVTFLTVGFGDFTPTHTVIKVLSFFFSIIGIAQLGNIISMLVQFFSSRDKRRREHILLRLEKRRRKEILDATSENGKPAGTGGEHEHSELHTEIEFLQRLYDKEAGRARMEQMASSLTGLVIFWVVGAAIFGHLEHWGYGTGMYFIYITFLTIGYGDLAPISPAARVVFVLYSIIAIPIMASFAVQAVQQVFSAFSERRYNRKRAKFGLQLQFLNHRSRKSMLRSLKLRQRTMSLVSTLDTQQDAETAPYGFQVDYAAHIIPHAELAEKWHHTWEEHGNGAASQQGDNQADEDIQDENAVAESSINDDTTSSPSCPHIGEENQQESSANDGNATIEEAIDENAKRILELALSLELRARRLLIAHLGGNEDSSRGGAGHAARVILTADSTIQWRDVNRLLKQTELERNEGELQDSKFFKKVLSQMKPLEDDVATLKKTGYERMTLEELRLYREEFAGLVVAGAKLLKLKGNERLIFERRRQPQPEDT